MTKKIDLRILSCSDCPYCRYDPYYDMHTDSGYDCEFSAKRIIDDWDWSNDNNPKRLCIKLIKLPIPDWCRLEDVKNE